MRSPRSSSLRSLQCAILAAIMLLSIPQASAFDYLEHSFFTDYACHQAQQMLGQELTRRTRESEPTTALAARYIALGLFCPARWETSYCKHEAKRERAHINLLKGEPDSSGKLSITLGDYSALPDHFARFGPVKNMVRAGDKGLWSWTVSWLKQGPGNGVGGVVENVAEDACEDQDRPPWAALTQDIDLYLARTIKAGRPGDIPEPMLSPIVRSTLIKGPADPAGVYSFNNPHYLDLILRNHNHFGGQAYSSWLGLHSAGVQIANRRCEQTNDLKPGQLRRLARDVPGYEKVSWRALREDDRADYDARACRLLSLILEARVRLWAITADPRLVDPVRPHLELLLAALPAPGSDTGEDAELEREDPLEAITTATLRDGITASVMALVFEGSSLHFLQDGLAAGHMRTIRTRGGLQEARYDHDRDNADGVVAVLQTRSGRFPFVAFGDTYMLAPGLPGPRHCLYEEMPPQDPQHVSNCLLAHQRGMLTAASMASLLDWALGGTLYGVELSRDTGHEDACYGMAPIEHFICAHLPSSPTRVAGEEGGAPSADVMHHGSLPVPPPPYSYEALTTRIGFDVAGRGPQINVSFSLLTELDDYANWLTSYRIGATASLGAGADEQWFTDFTYSFHWRWAARFILDAGASIYAGFRDFDHDTTFFMGASPVVGVTLLPEGWVKLPLELSISFRFPLTMFDSKQGFFGDRLLEGYWIYTGFGLAIMH